MKKTSTKNKPSDYKMIEKWGKHLCSDTWYIREQQRKAAEANAPLNAISERDGEWSTTDDITNDTVRRALGLPPLPIAPMSKRDEMNAALRAMYTTASDARAIIEAELGGEHQLVGRLNRVCHELNAAVVEYQTARPLEK